MSSLGFVEIKDFGEVNTGYTNKYLEDRNEIRINRALSADRMISEQAPSQDLIYSTLKDLEKTPVSNVFFSKVNVDYLQQQMREIVYKASNNVIGRQSDEELLIIMRSIYLSDAKNLPYDINRQVAELNYLVLRYAVFGTKGILAKVKGYLTYLNDNVRTNIVLPRSRYVSMKGARINRGTADLI